MPTLTVHNAEIKTATVEIRTLTISGKQVTLAVFRQLRERELVAEAGTLNGLPWGVVNYHPGKCGDDREHLHVVWQDGQELCRSRVDEPRWWGPFWADSADDFMQASYCANEHKYPEWAHRPPGRRDDIEFRVDGINCTANPSRPCAANPPSYGSASNLEPCKAADYAALHAEMVGEVEKEKARRKRHKALWTGLMELPQLFIAV